MLQYFENFARFDTYVSVQAEYWPEYDLYNTATTTFTATQVIVGDILIRINFNLLIYWWSTEYHEMNKNSLSYECGSLLLVDVYCIVLYNPKSTKKSFISSSGGGGQYLHCT